jgi:hypothetical protein
MAINPADNPFTLTYTALAKLLLSNPRLKRLLEMGTLIRYDKTGTPNPAKKDVTPGDLPEIILIPSGFTSNLHATSSSSRVLRQYTLLVSTGTQELNYLLNQVQWEVLIAFANWKSVMGALEWRDAAFVKRVDVLSIDEGLSDPALNRGVKGWSAIWSCEIEMYFQTSELLEFVDK